MALPGWSHYRETTVAGTSPSQESLQFRVFRDQPCPIGWNNVVVGQDDTGANQGIGYDGTHFYTSGKDATNPAGAAQTFINKWSGTFAMNDWTRVGVVNVATLFPSLTGQTNGIRYNPADGYLYVGGNNFPTNETSWIIVIDPSDLSLVTTHSVAANTTEGCEFWGGSAWVCYGRANRVDQYHATTWALQGQHNLPDGHDALSEWQAIQCISPNSTGGALFWMNRHEDTGGNARYSTVFYWDGNNFHNTSEIEPPHNEAGQGAVYVESEQAWLFALRNVGGVLNEFQVAKATATYASGDVGCFGRSRADYGDIRITSSDGNTIYAGDGTGWIEHSNQVFCFLHAVVPTQTTSAVMRCYYGNASATFNGDRASVADHVNDFEGGSSDFGDFTNVFSPGGGMQNVTTAPLEGSRHLITTANGGRYCEPSTFIRDKGTCTVWFRRDGADPICWASWEYSPGNLHRNGCYLPATTRIDVYDGAAIAWKPIRDAALNRQIRCDDQYIRITFYLDLTPATPTMTYTTHGQNGLARPSSVTYNVFNIARVYHDLFFSDGNGSYDLPWLRIQQSGLTPGDFGAETENTQPQPSTAQYQMIIG